MSHLTVITRKVSPTIEKCELVTRDREPISFARVQKQHDNYVKQFFATTETTETTTTTSFINVVELDALDQFPDSMFVEDTCVAFPNFAVLTRPGADSRLDEVKHIKAAVVGVFGEANVFELAEPARADGGDILLVGKHLFVGQSTRTNAEAVTQFKKIVEPCGFQVHAVDLRRERPGKAVQQDCMHLKCAVTKLDEKTVLLNPNWIPSDIFTDLGFEVVTIAHEAPEEQDGGNVLSYKTSATSRTVVVSSLYPKTSLKLKAYYESRKNKDVEGTDVSLSVLEVDEIAKAEGALTCCSLLCLISN